MYSETPSLTGTVNYDDKEGIDSVGIVLRSESQVNNGILTLKCSKSGHSTQFATPVEQQNDSR
jgi:hypothetical protein